MLVLHHPFDHFAFLDFQGLGERRGADQVPLPVLAPPLDHLDGGLITHAGLLAGSAVRGQDIIAVQLRQEKSLVFSIFLIFSQLLFVGTDAPLGDALRTSAQRWDIFSFTYI
jgi:hypothetical protein